jgi:hypothetical protein
MPEISEVPNWTMTFRGVRVGGLPYLVQEVSGLQDLPEVRTNDVELIQRDGLWAGDDYLGSRSVSFTIRCVGTSEEDLSNKVSILRRAFSSSRTEEPLYFAIPGIADGAPSKIIGRTRKFESVTDLAYGRFNAAFDIQFDCADPYIYPLADFGVRRHIYRGLDYHEGGAYCPLHFTSNGLWIPNDGGGKGTQTAFCHNGSTTNASVTCIIDGPLNGPIFKNLTTGAFVSVPNLTLSIGQLLYIEPNTAKTDWVVTLKQDTASSVVPKSQWGAGSSYFSLPPGLTELTIQSRDEQVVEYETHAVVSWVPGPYV